MNAHDSDDYFVPPLWLIEDYIPYLRASRLRKNGDRTLGEILADPDYEPKFHIWDYSQFMPPEVQE